MRNLGEVLRAAAGGEFPPTDGAIEVVAPYSRGIEAMVSFTAHAVAATTLSAQRLRAAGADGFAGALSATTMAVLAGPQGQLDVVDVVLVAPGTGRTTLRERRDLRHHPRVGYARRWRRDVQVHGNEHGLVTIARGLGGLPELSFEVEPQFRGRGCGRALLREGRGLVAAGEPVVIAVAPGNAASLRVALAAGFTPIASVQLVRPGRLP